MTEPTIRDEVRIDRLIDETGRAFAAASGRTTSAVELLHVAVKDVRVGTGRERRWAMSRDEVLAAAAEHPYFETYAAAAEAEAEALAAYKAASDQYRGWSRFYFVQNTGGHIHRTMACSTCFPTTRFAWLTDLSGLSEAEAVEAHGAILCTVCFPSAPVEWTSGEAKATIEAREARRAEREAKAAEKARRAAERAATHHFGLRKVRASDGAVFDDRTSGYSTPTTLKAAIRHMFEERSAFWSSIEVIDLNTGERMA